MVYQPINHRNLCGLLPNYDLGYTFTIKTVFNAELGYDLSNYLFTHLIILINVKFLYAPISGALLLG